MTGASGVAIAIHTISRPQLHRVSAVINVTLRGFFLFNRRHVSLFEVQATKGDIAPAQSRNTSPETLKVT